MAMAAKQVCALALRHLRNATGPNVLQVPSSSCSSSLYPFPSACRFYHGSAMSGSTQDGVWRSTLYPFVASSSSVGGNVSAMKWSEGSLADYDERSVGSGMPSLCGRGDKKTKKGKRFKGTFGNCRPKRGTEVRRLRKKWDIPHDPLAPDFTQPFPPRLA